MSGSNLSQPMQLLSDEALIEIVTFGNRDGYVPAAVEAARTELSARCASPWAIAATVQRLEARRKEAAELAAQPLTSTERIAFLVSSISFLSAFFASLLESKGYQRKSSEAWKWMDLGFALWIGVFVIGSLFRLFIS